MDYSYYVSHQYTLTPGLYNAGDVVYFCSDGEIATYDESGSLDGNSTMLEVLGRITNDYRRFELHNTNFMACAYWYTDNNVYLFNTNRIDYCGLSLPAGTGGGSLDVVAQFNEENYSLDESEGISNYYQFTGDQSYHNLIVGMYGSYNVTLNNNYICWFDYSNQKDGYAQQNAIAIRGENYSFYNTFLTLYTADLTSDFTYYYGNPIQSQIDSAYTSGYNAGTSTGYVQGYDTGYRNGQNSQPTTAQTQNAFNYIEGAFNVVTNIMSLEVLPHVTLGLAFSIPLVFVLIATLFKLVRK